MLPISHEEQITSIVSVAEFTDDDYLVMLTQKGFIKKTELSAFSNIRANGLIAISLEAGDQLRWVRRARAEDSIMISSRQGMAIHFRATHEQLRPLGRPTRGVKSMALRAGDELISMDILPSQVVATIAENDAPETEAEEELDLECSRQGPWALVITTGGLGKRVPVSQFRLQNRAGMGLRSIKFRKAGDRLAALQVVNENDEIVLVTSRGIIIRQAVNAISCQSRAATGVRVQRLDGDDAIVAVALVPPSNGEEALANGDEEAAEAAEE
jgi:DNA gyrase subunit A